MVLFDMILVMLLEVIFVLLSLLSNFFQLQLYYSNLEMTTSGAELDHRCLHSCPFPNFFSK